MFKTGVIIGKFYPPHRGHKYMIDTASAQVEHLTVLVCDKEGQTIPGELRGAWLKEIHPTVEVRVIDDTLHDDDSEAWAKYTIQLLGYVPEAVFTSEHYGEAYARYMGCRHVLVDLARQHVPCSGTAIRRQPLANWDYLEPCVRAYFAKRVCVVGAESTGTTTLAKALAEHYQTVWVPEFGRLYSEGKFTGLDAEKWETREFVYIATEQNRMEDEFARICNRVLICDTDAFATGIWHERYMGYRSPEVEALAAPRRYDLYLLTAVDIPFVQDGLRDGEHIRHWMHERFQSELAAQGKRFVVLSGRPDERLRQATALIDELLKPTAMGTTDDL